MNVPARRPSSVPPLPPKWTPKEQTSLENSFSLAGKSKSGETKRAPSSEDYSQAVEAHKEVAVVLSSQVTLMRMRDHFKASLKNRQSPQTGKMSENSRRDMLARKAERLEASRKIAEVHFFSFILLLFFH